MQVIANYLPQFYETEINNKHFGNGYTEWTAVKNASPFFEGHNQPRVPVDDNYYCLLNIEDLKWQVSLAKKYGIDGFAFYHYFFDSSRQELDKPVEILLDNKDIEMGFFFIWANESWGRNANRWTNIYDTLIEEDIFVEQRYDGEYQYRNHYEYVKRFIVDDRYIKIDGKPIFVIYNTGVKESLCEMMSLWTRWAIEDGLDGFYFVGINYWENDKIFDAILFQAPNAAYKEGVPTEGYRNGVAVKHYENVMDNILSIRDCTDDFYGIFVGFDNSPRYGNKHSLLIEKKDYDFEYYLRKVIKKNMTNKADMLFVNAWNEWGEGNYLEPDTIDSYCNLEAVLRAKKGKGADVSIIIPTYNVEEYIEECLDSIFAQNENDLKYELIIIDDGSTDSTLNIIKRYQNMYPEIVTIIKCEHKGVAAIRNIGLDMALGKYIYFVDADDYISKETFSLFVEAIRKNDVELCFFSFKNICRDPWMINKYADRLNGKKRNSTIENPSNGIDAFMQMWDNNEYFPLVWLQLIKREFIDKNNIRFQSDIIFEDQLFTFYVLYNAKKVVCYCDEIYNKRIRENSICTSKKGYEYLYSYLSIYRELNEFLKDKKSIYQAQKLLDSFRNRVSRFYYDISENERVIYEQKLDSELNCLWQQLI